MLNKPVKREKIRPRLISGPIEVRTIYVERPAETELYEALRRGEFCYLVAPPKSGKSSVRARVAGRFADRGIRTLTVDLSKMATFVPQEGFYYALIGQISEGLGLLDPSQFFSKHEGLSPAERWERYVHEELLPHAPGDLTIFIDEIDAARSVQGGADAFFAVLRQLFAKRDPKERRVTFCLIGSMLPEDLVRDPNLVPLDIARLIELRDLSEKETSVMLPALEGIDGMEGDAAKVMERIRWWTDGHPAMTQQLSEELQSARGTFGKIEEWIDRLVEQLYLAEDGRGRAVLTQAMNRFDAIGSDSLRAQALSLYRRLLYGERVPAQREDRVQLRLRAAGMIKQSRDEDGERWLSIRNRVFMQVIGHSWVEERSRDRALSSVVTRWLQSGKSPTQLLRDRDLDDALLRARPGRAAPDEEEFLRASLAVRTEEELRVTKERLKEAEQIHTEERTSRRKERVITASAFGLLTLLSILLGLSLSSKARRAALSESQALERSAQMQKLAEDQTSDAAKSRERLQHAVRRLSEVAGEAPSDKIGSLDEGEMIDGLSILALAKRPEHRGAALESAIRKIGEHRAKTKGDSAVETDLPPLLRRSLYMAVAESISEKELDPTYVGGAPYFSRLKGHMGQVRSVSVAKSPIDRVLTGSDDQSGRLWDGKSGRLLGTLLGHGEILRTTAFSPDGELLVTTSNDRTARVYRVTTGALQFVLRGHTAEVSAASFSTDGRLVTASGDGTARLWNMKTGLLQSVLRGHAKGLSAAHFSPDASMIITASQDGTAMIFSTQSGKVLATLKGHEGPLTAMKLSPDGKVIATASQDKTLRLWDKDGTQLFVLSGHTDTINALGFSGDGSFLVSASQDRSAKVWDTKTGKLRNDLPGHGGPVLALAISPDDGQIATASFDRIARIYTKEGYLLAEFRGAAGPLLSLAYSPDGQRLVVGSGDRLARIYPATITAFLGAACKLLAQRPEYLRISAACPSS